MCSGSEAGSYLRLIYCVYHATPGLRAIKKKRKFRVQPKRSGFRVDDAGGEVRVLGVFVGPSKQLQPSPTPHLNPHTPCGGDLDESPAPRSHTLRAGSRCGVGEGWGCGMAGSWVGSGLADCFQTVVSMKSDRRGARCRANNAVKAIFWPWFSFKSSSTLSVSMPEGNGPLGSNC